MAAAALLAAAPAQSSRLFSKRYVADGWTLDVQTDRFAERERCSLRSSGNRIIYQPGALGYRFAKRLDTLAAWYRVDNGAPRRWQDRYPQLIASGEQVDGPALDNPTGGIVWLPAAEVVGVESVTIRPAANARPKRFSMIGFASMLDAARRLGCASDADFAI